MKYFLALLLLLILFSSFKVDKRGPWIETRGKNILLYTRPLYFSNSPSPDSISINKILNSQELNYRYVDSFLKTNSNLQVKIYLYNKDEAKEKIGTNTGGGANTKLREIYFTFDTAIIRLKRVIMGNHELTHIIASNELSYPATKLMNEGYANALSNGYGWGTLEELMKFHIDKGNILTPTEMLENEKCKEFIYYPQAGYFTKWLINNYGIEKVNKLYPLKSRQIKKEIFHQAGKEFSEIEKEYLKDLERFK